MKQEKTKHDGDCKIYAALENPDNCLNGVCICGYGKQILKKQESYREMCSQELLDELRAKGTCIEDYLKRNGAKLAEEEQAREIWWREAG